MLIKELFTWSEQKSNLTIVLIFLILVGTFVFLFFMNVTTFLVLPKNIYIYKDYYIKYKDIYIYNHIYKGNMNVLSV